MTRFIRVPVNHDPIINLRVLSRVCLNEGTKSANGITSIKLFSWTHIFVMH